MSEPTEDEITEARNKADEAVNAGANPWPGMTYHQGVANTLAWIQGDQDNPLDEDE